MSKSFNRVQLEGAYRELMKRKIERDIDELTEAELEEAVDYLGDMQDLLDNRCGKLN